MKKGRCPRCGKPAAPYYLCDAHREYLRLKGIVYYHKKVGKTKTKTIKELDKCRLQIKALRKFLKYKDQEVFQKLPEGYGPQRKEK